MFIFFQSTILAEEKENPSSGNVETDISELCSPADSKDTLRASSVHDDGEEDSGKQAAPDLRIFVLERKQAGTHYLCIILVVVVFVVHLGSNTMTDFHYKGIPNVQQAKVKSLMVILSSETIIAGLESLGHITLFLFLGLVGKIFFKTLQ